MIPFKQIITDMTISKWRLALTVFSIAWGTVSIAFMLSLGEGIKVGFKRSVSSGEQPTLIFRTNETTQNYKGYPSSRQITFQKELKPDLLALPGVNRVSFLRSFIAKIRNGSHQSYADMKAITEEYPLIKSIQFTRGSRSFTRYDVVSKSRVILLGKSVAESLFKNKKNPLGKKVYLDNQPFQVIGIMKTGMGFNRFSSSLGSSIFIPLSTYQELTGDQLLTTALLELSSTSNVEQVQQSIRRTLARRYLFSDNDVGAVNFQSTQRSSQTISNFLLGFQFFLGFIGFLTLLVAAVGISNVMLMRIKRSKKTIGMRLAVGATPMNICLHYLIESLLITLTGGILGLAASYLLDYAVVQATESITERWYNLLGRPQPILSSQVLIGVVVVLCVSGFLAAFFPAIKASRVDPAVALRDEG